GLEARGGAGEPGDQQHDEERAVADGERLLDGAGEVDAPLREPAQHVDEEEGEPARVVRRAEAPTRDQPHRAERELRTVSHGLYLGYPWQFRPPPERENRAPRNHLRANCWRGTGARRATCRGAAPAIRPACSSPS